MKNKIISIISLLLVVSLVGGFLAFFSSQNNVVVPSNKDSANNNTSSNGQWVLITDLSMLTEGSKIIIAAKDYDFAMGSQNDNNRAAVSVEKNGNTLIINDDVQPIIVDNFFNITETSIKTRLHLGHGFYLYAPSSSQNYLKTTESSPESGLFTISIASDGVASIVADGVERNTLRFNYTSSLFSCYAPTNTMKNICIYVYTEN